MIRIGTWMFCFKVMRAFHDSGAFSDLRLCKKEGLTMGKIHGKEHLVPYDFGDFGRELILNRQKINEAYVAYVAQKELLEK